MLRDLDKKDRVGQGRAGPDQEGKRYKRAHSFLGVCLHCGHSVSVQGLKVVGVGLCTEIQDGCSGWEADCTIFLLTEYCKRSLG